MPLLLCPRLFGAECWIGLIDLMGVHGVIVEDGGNKGCFREVKCVALPQLSLKMPVSAGRNRRW